VISELDLRTTARHVELAITQRHHDPHHRNLVHAATQSAWREKPEGLIEGADEALPSFHDFEAKAPLHWAMTIDTTLCSGCSACVIACQAGNNIPVVGAEGVQRGREMHWLRIDSYRIQPSEDSLGTVHQPMLCQHCEHAPCEYVCPVFATAHSPDGLNEMVYNRCIGTRFCSNNCPYKVRRFNWFNYTSDSGTLQLQRNPEVSVRERGVMEKCTYCVQRIRRAEIQARVEQRSIAPGEVRTACQQACPTQAIQFGALEHEGTPMVQWRTESRSYSALRELGTRPRTRYLAKIYNPAPGGAT
jgi:molybdopterin-containing oxidoreductase family iron-sulfur binding subunit